MSFDISSAMQGGMAGYQSTGSWMGAAAGALAGGFGGGGGGDGASANDLAESQLYYNLLGMKHAPYATVTGLRRAGLNPMLAIGKATPQASIGMPSPVDDRQVSTARGLAAATIANQAAQADLYSAQAANVRAQTVTEAARPANIEMDTLLKQSHANQAEALETLAKNQSLYVAAQEVGQSLSNQVNKAFLPASKKEELLQLIAKTQIDQAQSNRARTDAAFFDSEIGKILRLVEHVVNALGLKTRGGDRISNTTINNRIPVPKGR